MTALEPYYERVEEEVREMGESKRWGCVKAA
jgi:hypothetical protein